MSNLALVSRVLFERFWAPGLECPRKCFFGTFGAKKRQKKHSKSTLWGTPSQVPKNAQKSTPWGTFQPKPFSTPVNGGRDRNPKLQTEKHSMHRRAILWRTFREVCEGFGRSFQKLPPNFSEVAFSLLQFPNAVVLNAVGRKRK